MQPKMLNTVNVTIRSPSEREQKKQSLAIDSGKKRGAQRIVLYGPGGIGKSTLASLAPTPIFLDIEEGTRELDVSRIPNLTRYDDVHTCLSSNILNQFETITLDTATRLEEFSKEWVIRNVKHEKGYTVKSIEGYGWGKGYGHVYDAMMVLIKECDRHIHAGRNVILIAHECIANVPNPEGDDFIRYEPHLQSPPSGKSSLRNRLVQWADHVLFVSYDIVSSDGKARGAGTRTISPVERPDHIAKSRLSLDPMEFTGPYDDRIWNIIFKEDHHEANG